MVELVLEVPYKPDAAPTASGNLIVLGRECGEYNTRKGNKPAGACTGFKLPAASAARWQGPQRPTGSTTMKNELINHSPALVQAIKRLRRAFSSISSASPERSWWTPARLP